MASATTSFACDTIHPFFFHPNDWKSIILLLKLNSLLNRDDFQVIQPVEQEAPRKKLGNSSVLASLQRNFALVHYLARKACVADDPNSQIPGAGELVLVDLELRGLASD